jgi:putative sterol carrier protein
MATLEECRAALEDLANRMAHGESDVRRHTTLDRSLSCQVTDLDVTFSGQLRDGHIHDITTDPAERAQIRMTVRSDDLIALVKGDLPFASAWARGRVRIEASMVDLLRLRSLI